MRRFMALFLCASLLLAPLLSCTQSKAEEAQGQKLRALLVGCDYFLTQDATYPAANSNVQMLSQALLSDTRGYTLIRTESGTISTVAGLGKAISAAFASADEDDISLFYISTHGVYPPGTPLEEAALLLSDGKTEEKLYVDALEEMLDAVKGTKVLILDACNAGAFIGKGLSFPRNGRTAFAGPEYKVLCSAGGSEESWYWKSEDDGDPEIQYGASYFASVLAAAMGSGGVYPADRNADGLLTLRETYDYLLDNYAASTPQVYPENDESFPLFAYDLSASREVTRLVTDLSFEDTVLTTEKRDVTFSFTLRAEAKLYYQLIYYQHGAWDFENAQMLSDAELSGNDVSPGRKARTLTLSAEKTDTAGYVMLLLITKEKDRPVLQGSRLLCVQPAAGANKLHLSVRTGGSFCPAAGDELNILVGHAFPCSLTVSVLNKNGDTVRRIAYDLPSRPQAFRGSTLCWDGKASDGTMAAPGEYTVRVQTRIGGELIEVQSQPFLLTEPEEE